MDFGPDYETDDSADRMQGEGNGEDSMGSALGKARPPELVWAAAVPAGESVSDDLDTAANGIGPKGLTRAAYARKVFVASKTGYLMKKSGTELRESNGKGVMKIKFMNYVTKKRFFVLTGASLMYHRDHRNLDDPTSSKEILLDGNSRVRLCEMPSPHLGIELVADGKVTKLGARDEPERQEWMDAIASVIRKLEDLKRGYLLKLRAGVPTPSPLHLSTAPLAAAVESGDFKHASETLLEGKAGSGEWTRKYFMLDGGKLTFHASHSSTLVVQGSFKLPSTTQVEVRQGLLLVVRIGAHELVCRAAEEGDLSFWESAINEVVTENAIRRSKIMEERAARGEDPLAASDDPDDLADDWVSPLDDSWTGAKGVSAEEPGVIRSKGFDATHGGSFAGLEGRGGGALLKGDLVTRPVSGKGPWRAAYYVIEKGRLLVFEDRHHVRPKQVHKISPSCSVFETNLKYFSFEVVVSGKVLHLQGSSNEDSLRWIATLKAAINNSPPDDSDPLLAEALKLEDTFYYADFETKQPLGVVLERSKEWAIVKVANPQLSQVSVGSALASVNGESVVLRAYDDTLAMLRGWKPPLNLIFRRAPVKDGLLKKIVITKKAQKGTKWKQMWVDLREGKLSWYRLSPGGTPLGAIQIVGSAVALVSPNEIGAVNCFSVAAGVASAIFQAPSHQGMLSWAAHIYQASAVANGGGYLLDQERDQETAYEEERRRRLQLEAAERDRFVRSKRQEQQRQQGEDGDAFLSRGEDEEEVDRVSGAEADTDADTDGAEEPRVVVETREETSSVDTALPGGVVVDAALPGGVVIDAALPEGVVIDAALPAGVVVDAAGDDGLSLSPPGSQLFVAEAGSGSLFVVDAGTPEEVEVDVSVDADVVDVGRQDTESISPGEADEISLPEVSAGDASVATEGGADADATEVQPKEEVEIITGAGASPHGEEERPSLFSPPREGGSSRGTESETLVDRSTAACSECSAGVDNGGQEQQPPTPGKEASMVMKLIREREAAAAAAAAAAVSAAKHRVVLTVPAAASKAPAATKARAATKANATKQLESAALKSPGLAAALQRTAEGRAWGRKSAADTKPDAVATDAALGEVKKPVSPSLTAARTRGLPSQTAWNGGNVDRVGSASLTASDAFAATRSSKDIGTERNHKGAHGKAARGKPAVVIASDEAMPAEKIVSPFLAAARMRGVSIWSALVFNDIGATSFSSASELSHSRKSSFDSGGHGWDSRRSSYDSGGRARGVARKEPPVNAAPLKITVGAKPDVLDAHDSVISAGEESGGKVVSPSLAAARSRRLLDRSAWSGSAGESSLSSRPDASDDRRLSHENAAHTNGRKSYDRASVKFAAAAPAPVASFTTNFIPSFKKSVTKKEGEVENAKSETKKDSSVCSAYFRALENSNSNNSKSISATTTTTTTNTATKGLAHRRDPVWKNKHSSPVKRKENAGKSRTPGVADDYVRAAASAATGVTRSNSSPTPAGGRSLSPASASGAGGAAATGATARPLRGDAAAVGVQAMSKKLFGPSGPGLPRGAGWFGGGGESGAVKKNTPPEPAGGLIGGPWDEEKILKWVRDVTGMDIDPECGVYFSLKDGVALCRLMSKLRPGEAVPAPSESSLPYKQMANIYSFLRSCRNLGLGESILFEATDLHEEKNIPAVVKTLVALGESAPRTCPKFTGAKLNMRNFKWSTAAVSSSSSAGTSQVKSFPRRASSGVNGSGISNGGARSSSAFSSNGSSGSSGKIGGGAWPRVGGSGGGGLVTAAVAARSGGSSASAVGNPPNGVWRSGMGDHGPANSEEDDDYDDDDDDSEGDYDEEEAGNYHAVGAGMMAKSTHVGGMIRDKVLTKAYDSLKSASQGSGLSLVQFSSLWRSLSGGQQNLFAEMKMFNKFNTSGGSVIDLEEFKAGFRLLARENAKEYDLVLSNLRGWAESKPASF